MKLAIPAAVPKGNYSIHFVVSRAEQDPNVNDPAQSDPNWQNLNLDLLPTGQSTPVGLLLFIRTASGATAEWVVEFGNYPLGNQIFLMGASLGRRDFEVDFRTNLNNPLRTAMRENSVYAWTPRAPFTIFYCRGDRTIPFENAQIAYQSFTNRGALGEQGSPLPNRLLY